MTPRLTPWGCRIAAPLLLVACGAPAPLGLVVAHQGGGALWPPNSRTAFHGAIDSELPALTFDVGLTADHVAVLFDGPFLTPDTCVRSSGAPLPEPVDVRRLRADTLQQGFLCGGIAHAAFPNALVVDDAVLTVAELAHTLHDGATGLQVRLRVDASAGAPLPVAKAVLEAWFAEDIPQDLVIASPDPSMLDAFVGQMRILGVDVPLHLVLPDAGSVAGEVERWVGGNDWVARAEAAGAVGLWVPVEQVHQGQLRAARQAGLLVDVFVVDDPKRIAFWAVRADSVTSNYPGEAP